MKYIVTLFWLMVATLMILFTTMNAFSVTLHYPSGSFKIFLPLLLCMILFAGAMLGLCAVVPWLIRAKSKMMKLKGELKQSQKELDNLRKLPLTDS